MSGAGDSASKVLELSKVLSYQYVVAANWSHDKINSTYLPTQVLAHFRPRQLIGVT